MWIAPENVDPTLLLAPTRKSISAFGAVSASNGRLASMVAPIFNAETFLAFLKRLIKRRKKGYRMLVILDNARWHHSKLIRPWLEENKRWIELIFLPPYSPHLNPIERVWKLTRYNVIHNRYFTNLSEIKKSVLSQFRAWSKPNNTLAKLCAII